jgi:hypothetical protein
MEGKTEGLVITLTAIVVCLMTTVDATIALAVALAFQICLGIYYFVRRRRQKSMAV